MKKILLFSNTSWSIYNYRRNLVKHLINGGHSVTVILPDSDYSNEIRKLGCQTIAIKFSQNGKSIFSEIRCLVSLLSVFKKVKPEIYLGFTIKPNIYGGIISRFTGTKSILNITGLGRYINTKHIYMQFILLLAYKFVCTPATVLFQNRRDKDFFINKGIVNETNIELLPGSGVDLQYFSPSLDVGNQLPASNSIKFSFIGRLLIDKGILLFLQASRVLKKEFPNLNFEVVGQLGIQDDHYVSEEYLQRYVSDAIVHYEGFQEDIRPTLENTHCVVLPSFYNEGTPRILLEAGAVGVPIITTQSPGCEDTVSDGLNGFLCKPNDLNDLIKKMRQFALQSTSSRLNMGSNSRRLIEEKFDERIVVEKYENLINTL